MDCEVCGKKDASFIIQVEGAKLAACRACAYHGKILLSLEEEGPVSAPTGGEIASHALKMEEDLIEGYGRRIKAARERKGQKIEEFAKEISQKANYIDMIEGERTRPSLELAKKIEKALGIRLIEKTAVAEAPTSSKKQAKGDLSLLDMLEMQNKGKGKKK